MQPFLTALYNDFGLTAMLLPLFFVYRVLFDKETGLKCHLMEAVMVLEAIIETRK